MGPRTETFRITRASDEASRFRRGADGKFVNLDGTGPQPFRNVYKWAVADKLAGRRRKSPARADVPAVAIDPAVLAAPPATGQGARLTWLGHASWLVQLGGVSLLIDPVLGPSITGVIKRNAPLPLAADQLPPIAAQLVSHNHYDHMDLPTLRAVGAPVVAGIGNGRSIGGHPSVTELGWWDSADVGGVTVTFVPSQHWSRRALEAPNSALWGGFIIESAGLRVYHSGDTAYFDGFREIGRRFPGLDAALLPIGAYDPAWFMSKQHMNPDEALRAHADLGARRVIAMHWGTFKLTDEPLDEPPVLFREGAQARGWSTDQAKVAAVGETIVLPPPGV
ncbi:MAG TPA: MBL fold metallo-hydrolase [Polyangia bacterium]|nr:MBL fold metallo-hydrolase [Polyangia bacterium]